MATCAAVIIDNRPGLEPIIEMHEKFLPNDWDVFWIKNEETTSSFEYSKLLTSKRLWRNLPDWVLIFQHDTELYKKGIEEFIGQYDFIGAHIKWMPGYFNGGLSLRNSKSMLKVINQIPYNGQNEDLYFVDGLRKLNGKLPTAEIAHTFSVETEFHYGSLGAHQIDRYFTKEQCTSLRNQYK